MPDPSNPVNLFFWLFVVHQLMDFALQSTPIALEKSRHSTTPLQREVPWYYWLTAHAFLHGGGVAWVTNSVGIGLLESVTHWIIDFIKSDRITNIHQDQMLHYICKMIWVMMVTHGVDLRF